MPPQPTLGCLPRHWEDFRQCGPTKACPTCTRTPKCHHSSEGGLLTNIDAMYGTFRLNFHHLNRVALGLRGHTHARGADLSWLRLKLADMVLI